MAKSTVSYIGILSARPVIHSVLVYWNLAPGEREQSAGSLEALPVADDDRERTRVHEVDEGKVEHDAVEGPA